MDQLLVYYLPNKNSFIYKLVKTYNEVGYINSYGHILVQILVYDYKIEKFVDYDYKFKAIEQEKKLEYEKIKAKRLKKVKRKKIKNELINQVIDLLYRIKSR